jgi:hypothetical protein
MIGYLDILVLLLAAICVLHACKRRDSSFGLTLCFAAFLLGLLVEQASIRFGGTHCHAPSPISNISDCSSTNSVLYYLPWLYLGITSAPRLTPSSQPWAFPFIAAILFFGQCGVYEMQGPYMKWWKWPDQNNEILGFQSHGILKTTDHAAEALDERIFGFPVMALYFHVALGWGIAKAIQKAEYYWYRPFNSEVLIFAVILGPAISMIFDPIVRLCTLCLGASKTASVSCIIALVFIVPLLYLATQTQTQNQIQTKERDWLLFSVSAINHTFFLYNALLGDGANVLPGDLKMLLFLPATLGLCGTALATNIVSWDDTTVMKPAKANQYKGPEEVLETISSSRTCATASTSSSRTQSESRSPRRSRSSTRRKNK